MASARALEFSPLLSGALGAAFECSLRGLEGATGRVLFLRVCYSPVLPRIFYSVC